jgi:hypothetical protein
MHAKYFYFEGRQRRDRKSGMKGETDPGNKERQIPKSCVVDPEWVWRNSGLSVVSSGRQTIIKI